MQERPPGVFSEADTEMTTLIVEGMHELCETCGAHQQFVIAAIFTAQLVADATTNAAEARSLLERVFGLSEGVVDEIRGRERREQRL